MSSALHIIYVKQTLSRLLAMLANAADLAFRIGRIKETMLGLMLLDLEPAREELTSYYSNRRGGSKPRDPVAMLRCLILMAMMNVTSLNDWSARLKGEPELAVLCGFKPGDAPGVGTLYDFCGRVEDGPYEEARACGRTPRSKRRKEVYRLAQAVRTTSFIRRPQKHFNADPRGWKEYRTAPERARPRRGGRDNPLK